MNNIKYISLSLAVLIMLSVSSCKKNFYTDANINHNAPSYVPPANLLPAVEVAIAYTQGGDLSRFTSMMTQQTAGISRQCAAYYTYVYTGQDFDGLWGNLYTTCMQNCENYIQVADAKSYYGHSGIGRLLLAYTLQMTVDAWGSIPYSSAFQGVANLNPAYDNDKAVYAAIAQLVNDGITKLAQNSTSAVALQPGSEDFIYGGDVAKWTKFGHAILARLYIHQSKGNVAMATAASSEVDLAMQSNADNAQVMFSTSGTGNGPWYQFNNQRDDINFAFINYPSSTTCGGILLSSNDPRYSILIDSTGELNTGIGLGVYYGNPNSPVEFISYDEMMLVKAEALLRSAGNTPGAQSAYASAITANMTKLGVASADMATYLAAHGTITGATVANAIDSVGNQAYIALYLNPEAWATWRRTAYPTLTPTNGTNGVPRRFLYPQTEYSYNAAHVGAFGTVTLWSPKVFWDN